MIAPSSIKVVESSDCDKFEELVNGLLKAGYKLQSSSCWFGGRESDGFCPLYQAILLYDVETIDHANDLSQSNLHGFPKGMEMLIQERILWWKNHIIYKAPEQQNEIDNGLGQIDALEWVLSSLKSKRNDSHQIKWGIGDPKLAPDAPYNKKEDHN
jgi:hypothetical protein